MTTHSSFAFRSAVDRFAAWRKHRRDLHDLADLGGVDFCAIARDLRLSPGDLEAVAKNDGSRTENLDGLLSTLGIDAAKMVRTEPAVMRDMERVCALCPAVGRCSRDLRAGISRYTYRQYCANTHTIDAIEAE